MKLFVLLMIAFSFSVAPVQASQKVRILPFKIWKHKKIDEAKSIVSDLRRESKRAAKNQDDSTEDTDGQTLSRKLSQAELNLDVAKDLSANDYFVLYVAPQFKDNLEALTQAAKTLSAKDMADILSAYQKRLQPMDVFGAKNTTMVIAPEAM